MSASTQQHPAAVAGARSWPSRAAVPAAIAALALLAWFGPVTRNVVWPGLFGIDTDPNVHADMLVYFDYAQRIGDGLAPYGDFAFEYPPLALAIIVAPFQLGSEVLAYRDAFTLIVGLLLAGAAVCAALAARAIGAPRRIELAAGALVALGPLLLDHDIAANRYDLLPVFLVALAALLAARGRLAWAGAAVGLGLAAKLWPLVLLVPILALAARKGGRREVARGALAFAAAALVPFAIAAAWGGVGGLAEMFEIHADRPLQVESVGASVLVLADGAGLAEYEFVGSFGSLNVVGGAADLLPTALSLLGLGVLAFALWLGVRRVRESDGDGEAFEWAMLAGLAGVVCLVVLGKVGSPQFALWALPLPFLIGEHRRWWAAGLVAASLVLTNLAFRNYFAYGLDHELGPALLYVARGAVLVALLVFLVSALARRGTGRSSRSAAA